MLRNKCNVFFIGIQKNKELRDLFKRAKVRYEKFNPKSFAFGDVYLPFFACKEESDKGSHFLVENELACALKAFLDAQIKFFRNSEKIIKQMFVLGMTCVGHIVTAYIMRKIYFEDEEKYRYAMQPIQTFIISNYEDLLKLAKFLSGVRKFGNELLNDFQKTLQNMVKSNEEEDSEDEEESEKKSPKRKIGYTHFLICEFTLLGLMGN